MTASCTCVNQYDIVQSVFSRMYVSVCQAVLRWLCPTAKEVKLSSNDFKVLQRTFRKYKVHLSITNCNCVLPVSDSNVGNSSPVANHSQCNYKVN